MQVHVQHVAHHPRVKVQLEKQVIHNQVERVHEPI